MKLRWFKTGEIHRLLTGFKSMKFFWDISSLFHHLQKQANFDLFLNKITQTRQIINIKLQYFQYDTFEGLFFSHALQRVRI